LKIKTAEVARAALLRRIYDFWVAQIPAGEHLTDWIDVEGLPGKEISARGAEADLVIIDRLPEPINQFAKDALHAALFDTHRPVLVVPPAAQANMGRRIVVAWRDDGRAIKAVIPAIRYFADAEVSVLAGYRGKSKLEAIPAPLVDREITAKIYLLMIGPEPFGKDLLAKATELNADLLVMGAYSHSPLREMLLGGVTRYVLAHSEIPVLMRH
jgi:nucleotide-binding universal stress UspA family protein